jgi:hypothetical protein
VLRPCQHEKLATGDQDKKHVMSQKLNAAIAVIGIDIGKNSLHIVGRDHRGAIALRQKWSRGQVETRSPTCHRDRYEFRDAEAIAEAVQRPAMKFVATKTADQLDLQALHRVRDRFGQSAYRRHQSDPCIPAGARHRRAARPACPWLIPSALAARRYSACRRCCQAKRNGDPTGLKGDESRAWPPILQTHRRRQLSSPRLSWRPGAVTSKPHSSNFLLSSGLSLFRSTD